MGKILGLNQTHFIILLLVVAAFTFGYVKLPVGVASIASTGGVVTSTASGAPLAYCTKDTNTADVNIKLTRSVIASDGTLTNVDADTSTSGAGAQVVFEGSNSAWQTVSVEGGATSTSPDPTCGQKFYLTIRNDTYYNTTVGPFVAGDKAQYEVQEDLIPTLSLSMDNTTAQGTATRGSNTTISGTGGSYLSTLNIQTTTAQGVLHLDPGIICIRTNSSSNLDRTNTRPIGASASKEVPGLCNGGGAADQVTAWSFDKGVVKDTAIIKVPMEFHETSGNNAATNTIVEILVVDKGGYILNGKTVYGYTTQDGISDIGATSTVGSAGSYVQYFG